MTKEQSNYLKANWINFSTLIIVVTFIVGQAKWQQKQDAHIEEFKQHVEHFQEHKLNTTLHMPFEDKIQVFVPRTEIDSRLKNIETLLRDLKSDIKRMK